MKNFDQYLNERGYRLNTVRGYTQEAETFIKWTETENINPQQCSYNELLSYVNYCAVKGNSKHTMNQRLNSLKHFFNYLMATVVRQDNPATELRIKNTIRKVPHDLLSKEVLENIYKNYPANGITGKRNKAMLGLMIYQGATTAELTAIEVTDLKLEEAKVYVPATGRSNSRLLKLEAMQIIQLQNYVLTIRPVLLAMTEKQTDKLFMSTGKGTRLSNSFARLMRIVAKLNNKAIDTKQIRASVITEWLKVYNIRQVQYMTGHRYVSSTGHYRTDKLEGLQEQLENLHPMK